MMREFLLLNRGQGEDPDKYELARRVFGNLVSAAHAENGGHREVVDPIAIKIFSLMGMNLGNGEMVDYIEFPPQEGAKFELPSKAICMTTREYVFTVTFAGDGTPIPRYTAYAGWDAFVQQRERFFGEEISPTGKLI